ncbi:MAG: EF-hand domain-containing protein [Pseudomonadota bacterium]
MSALMVMSSAALAQNMGFGGPGQAPFATLDADGNGEISPAEIQARGALRFEAADTDNDGFLSIAELEARTDAQQQRFVMLLIARADSNRDGKLTLEEMRSAGAQRRDAEFRKLDTDGSGGLNQAELAAGAQKARQNRSAQSADKG